MALLTSLRSIYYKIYQIAQGVLILTVSLFEQLLKDLC